MMFCQLIILRFHKYTPKKPDKINNRTTFSASVLDIYLTFDTNGKLSIRLYGKGVIRSCVSKKDRPSDDKQKKEKQ